MELTTEEFTRKTWKWSNTGFRDKRGEKSLCLLQFQGDREAATPVRSEEAIQYLEKMIDILKKEFPQEEKECPRPSRSQSIDIQS
jgi:hypothetical protein